MTALILVLILAVLIFVHELGHFAVAKWIGARVDEFAIGFPPNLLKKKIGETTYKLNAIPFGGYVKIFGEKAEQDPTAIASPRAMQNKSWWKQALVLLAGIAANILTAWIMLSVALMLGAPIVGAKDSAKISNQEILVMEITEGSLAENLGILPGDKITELTTTAGTDTAVSTMDLTTAITSGDAFSLQVISEESEREIFVPAGSDRLLGISFQELGTAQYSFLESIGYGFTGTVRMTGMVATGFYEIIRDALKGDAGINALTGPVGLAEVVGDARSVGVANVLILTAFISINLAILNLFPFPALDGGRLLFLIIEKIKGSPINPKVFMWVNGVGFSLLILLMIVVTVKDIVGLF